MSEMVEELSDIRDVGDLDNVGGGVRLDEFGSTHDGITSDTGDEFTDIDDNLLGETAAEMAEEAKHRGGPLEPTASDEPGVYRSIYAAQSADESAPDAGQDGVQTPGGPGDPPFDQPPSGGGTSEFPDPEDSDGSGGEGAEPYRFVPDPNWDPWAGADRPRTVEPQDSQPEFVDPEVMLSRQVASVNAMARVEGITTALNGLARGRERMAELRAAEVRLPLPPPEPPLIAERLEAEMAAARAREAAAAAAANAPTVELPTQPPTDPRVLQITVGGQVYGQVELPQRTAEELSAEAEEAPAADETPAQRELRERRAQAAKGPDLDAGPPDHILERVLAGLRRAEGQKDMGARENLGPIVVEEPTAAEIEAAGGDIAIARANKIAAIQEQRRQRREGGGQQPQ